MQLFESVFFGSGVDDQREIVSVPFIDHGEEQLSLYRLRRLLETWLPEMKDVLEECSVPKLVFQGCENLCFGGSEALSY
jgi:hypothetical protein